MKNCIYRADQKLYVHGVPKIMVKTGLVEMVWVKLFCKYIQCLKNKETETSLKDFIAFLDESQIMSCLNSLVSLKPLKWLSFSTREMLCLIFQVKTSSVLSYSTNPKTLVNLSSYPRSENETRLISKYLNFAVALKRILTK